MLDRYRNRSRSAGMSRSCPLPSPVAFRPARSPRGSPGLARDELGGTGDLVRDRNLGGVQDVSRRVVSTLQVEERCHSRHTERDVGRAPPKRSSERVADDDRNVLACQLADAFTEAAADASGSTGRRTRVSSPLAFDWSTPAEAQTKPCRVSAITSGGRARTIRRLSRRITSRRRASSSAASSLAWSDGSIPSRCTTRPSTFDTAFERRRRRRLPLARFHGSQLRRGAARSSPSSSSGMPRSGMTRSSPVKEARSRECRRGRGTACSGSPRRRSCPRVHARAGGPASKARPAISRSATSRARRFAAASSPHTKASSSGGSAEPRVEAARCEGPRQPARPARPGSVPPTTWPPARGEHRRREAELRRHAQKRPRADGVSQESSGVERSVRVGGEDDEIGCADGVLVRRPFDSELCRSHGGSGDVAGAEHDGVAGPLRRLARAVPNGPVPPTIAIRTPPPAPFSRALGRIRGRASASSSRARLLPLRERPTRR